MADRNPLPLERFIPDGEDPLAVTAPEDIVGSAARRGLKRTPQTAFDPASGALYITPERDLEIRKAVRRAARKIAFRLYLLSLRLHFRYLTLKARCACLKILRDFCRYFQKLMLQ